MNEAVRELVRRIGGGDDEVRRRCRAAVAVAASDHRDGDADVLAEAAIADMPEDLRDASRALLSGPTE
jgi:hypothetical protein